MTNSIQYTNTDVREMLLNKASELGSQKALALLAGVSESFLSDVLANRREPSGNLLSILKLKRIVTYQATQ